MFNPSKLVVHVLYVCLCTQKRNIQPTYRTQSSIQFHLVLVFVFCFLFYSVVVFVFEFETNELIF